jgi:hypothetical protein
MAPAHVQYVLLWTSSGGAPVDCPLSLHGRLLKLLKVDDNDLMSRLMIP